MIKPQDLFDLYALNVYDRGWLYNILLDEVHETYKQSLRSSLVERLGSPYGSLWGRIMIAMGRLEVCDKMLYIDGINQLHHYHGKLIDYVDGRLNWALDVINVARTPLEYWDQTSREVRRCCWRYVCGERKGYANDIPWYRFAGVAMRRVGTIITLDYSDRLRGTYRFPYYRDLVNRMRIELSAPLDFSITYNGKVYLAIYRTLQSMVLNREDKIVTVEKTYSSSDLQTLIARVFPFNYADMLARLG